MKYMLLFILLFYIWIVILIMCIVCVFLYLKKEKLVEWKLGKILVLVEMVVFFVRDIVYDFMVFYWY